MRQSIRGFGQPQARFLKVYCVVFEPFELLLDGYDHAYGHEDGRAYVRDHGCDHGCVPDAGEDSADDRRACESAYGPRVHDGAGGCVPDFLRLVYDR